jgi:hypothetical protein
MTGVIAVRRIAILIRAIVPTSLVSAWCSIQSNSIRLSQLRDGLYSQSYSHSSGWLKFCRVGKRTQNFVRVDRLLKIHFVKTRCKTGGLSSHTGQLFRMASSLLSLRVPIKNAQVAAWIGSDRRSAITE